MHLRELSKSVANDAFQIECVSRFKERCGRYRAGGSYGVSGACRMLDRDTELAAKFRREVAAGSDSIAVIEALVSPEMAKKIGVCRFETVEYLTKRGFPPFY